MKQIFCLGGISKNTTTAASGANSQGVMSGIGHTSFWDFDDDGLRQNVVPAPGTIRRLIYNIDSAAGSGHYRGLRFDIDGSSTTDVRCNNPSVIASEPYAESVTAGQLVRVEATEDSDSATSSSCRWGIGWEGDNDGEAVVGSSHGNGSQLIGTNVSTTYYYSIVSGVVSSTTESNMYTYAPLSGTIKSFYIASSRDLYGGTWAGDVTFSIYINGTEQVSSQIVFQNDDTSGNVTGLSLAFSAGDTITVGGTTSASDLGTSASGAISFGVMYTPDTDGESMIGGGTLDDLDSTTRYLGMNFVMQSSQFNPPAFSTESDAQGISPGSFTLKDLRVNLVTAPGAGESRTFTIRKNGSDTSLTCTVSGTGTSCTDTSNTATFTAEDLFSLGLVDDNGAAATTDFHWSAVMYDVDFPTFRPHLITF